MTILELFIYACKEDIINNEVEDVINKFHTSEYESVCANNNVCEVTSNSEKIEWSYEEVMELFNS